MKLSQKSYERIKTIIKKDKEGVNLSFLQQMKSDLYLVLKDYMEIKLGDLEIRYFIDDGNRYKFDIVCRSSKLNKYNS